jgi:hypothetical protein
MKVRHLLVALGISTLLALSACEQQTTNPGPGGGGYPGNGPSGAGAGASSGSMSSGSSGSMSSGGGGMR